MSEFEAYRQGPPASRPGPEPTRRELRAVTRDALAEHAERASAARARELALAALAQLDGPARPGLREPYVYRTRVQPGLWLTVDDSHNIILEVRSADEAELLAAYALSDTATLAAQLDLCRIARDAALQEDAAGRQAGLRDAMALRDASPGDDLPSRQQAVSELLAAGLPASAAARVLKRAHGHLSATFNVAGTDQLGTVTYDREHGTYAVRVPAADEAMAENIMAEIGGAFAELRRLEDRRDAVRKLAGPQGRGARARWARPPEPRGEV